VSLNWSIVLMNDCFKLFLRFTMSRQSIKHASKLMSDFLLYAVLFYRIFVLVDFQDPHSIAVLLQNDLVVVDLTSQG